MGGGGVLSNGGFSDSETISNGKGCEAGDAHAQGLRDRPEFGKD